MAARRRPQAMIGSRSLLHQGCVLVDNDGWRLHDVVEARAECAVSVTIHAVARRANVSISTVSLAFTSPDLVKQQTRSRVLAAASVLGFHATGAAPRAPASRTVSS